MKDITLINSKTGEFKTFWKNVHGQCLISEGKFHGLTYEVGSPKLTERDPGNAEFLRLRKLGWIKWQDFCKMRSIYIGDYGYYLI